MSAEQKHECTPVACEYDAKVQNKGWRGPEVTFGMAYSSVQPGDTVLDIGIGTGLSSILFHQAGLRVFGMDMSTDMLKVCKEKKIAEDLRQHDLQQRPYPFDSGSMNHVISIGVLNHFQNLEVVFAEATRILRDGGTFSFMVLDRLSGEPAEFVLNLNQDQPGKSVTLYRHGIQDIDPLLNSDFSLLKSVEFTVYLTQGKTNPMSAVVYIYSKNCR